MRYRKVNKFIILCFLGGTLLLYNMLNMESEFTTILFDNSCPLRDIITVREGGRFGNCFFEYASAVVLGNLLGLSPYVPRSILNCLNGVFQNLSAPAYEDTILSDHCRMLHGGNAAHCKAPLSTLIDERVSPWDYLCNTIELGESLNHSVTHYPVTELKIMKEYGKLSDVVILPKWTAHYEAIISLGLENFRQLFQLRSDVLELVKKTITGVLKISDVKGEVSLVGVHARLTDYNTFLENMFGEKVSFATPGYYKRAMEKMRALKPNIFVIFMIVSDDREWCMKELVNEKDGVFWGGMEGSPFHDPADTQNTLIQSSHDFALLASLNDSIISYGTFSLAGALLAGGHTIGFDMNVSTTETVPDLFTLDKYLENWEVMN